MRSGTASPPEGRAPWANSPSSWSTTRGCTRRSRSRSARASEPSRPAPSAIRNLNLPTGNDVDRLARRLRAVSERLEEVEDALDQLAAGVAALRRERDSSRPRASSSTLSLGLERCGREPLPCARRRPRPAPRPRSACRPPFRKVSDTASTQAVATPSRPPSVNIVAASISTATAPRLRQASERAAGAGLALVGPAVVEEIRGHDPRRRGHARERSGQAPRSAPGSGSAISPAPSARLAPSSASASPATTSSPVYEVRIERAAGAHPDRAPHPQLGQLLEDDRGARPSHAGGLDAERPALGRLARVAPEPAGVVAHPRLGRAAAGRAPAPGRGRREAERPARTRCWAGGDAARGEHMPGSRG